MSESHTVNLVFEKVSFVNKISTILKATSDDDRPIPGYLYQEISKITHESDGYCESTLEYLVDRLERNSCHIKLKVIKVMKYLLENGHRNFRFGLLKKSRGITAATKFSGAPDPLHGNVPYLMVRKAAQELSEMLFDTEVMEANLEGQDKESVKLINTGSMGSSNHQTGKLEGFGNSPAVQKSTFGDNLIDNVYKLAEKINEQPADRQRELLKTVQNVGEYKPPMNITTDSSPLVTPFTKPEVKSYPVEPMRKHVPGKAGGGWDDSDDDVDSRHGHSQSSGKKSSGSNNDLLERMEVVTLEDWSGEENLVNNTVDNGQSFLLKRIEIKNFVQNCHQLSCYKILELLNQRLKSGVDNHRMRSLLLVENLLTTDLISIDRVIRTCKGNLIWLVGNCTGPIASKANKIIKILERLSNNILFHGSAIDTNLNGQALECDLLGQQHSKHMQRLQCEDKEENVNANTERDIELLLQQDPSKTLYSADTVQGQSDMVQSNNDIT
ncbi:AP-4 complex accessory subunit Tepsin-like isoform X2 [Ylistrum balloti]|uniref:AP-4 complex accessory subunit Tepsin-like isoform X2 n=1 Tax=Ylistrum balloti TaxID=509963 RepID=UPI0029059750|nr:AP-4 complex accessory subunit Tepsin-like isoform X2 [Ylistrum balloti]